jgi:hypothetical protein
MWKHKRRSTDTKSINFTLDSEKIRRRLEEQVKNEMREHLPQLTILLLHSRQPLTLQNAQSEGQEGGAGLHVAFVRDFSPHGRESIAAQSVTRSAR